MPTAHGDVTQLLAELGAGDEEAAERLLPLVYEELRALAERNLRHERADHTLQATALVHEAYIRLVDSDQIRLRTRAHFFALAARAMRRILVDHARAHRARKRAGKRASIPVEAVAALPVVADVDVVALDDAMRRLGEFDERSARIVEMRFFGGMTMEQIAELLEVSISTVEREWRVARAWLYLELTKGRTPRPGRRTNARGP